MSKKAKWKEVIDGVWALDGEHEICVTKSKAGPWVAYKPHAHWADGMMAGITGEKPPWHVELDAKTLKDAKREAVGLIRESLEESLAALP